MNTVVPSSISADDWIRNNTLRWRFLLIGSLLVAVTTVVVIAVARPPRLSEPQVKAITDTVTTRADSLHKRVESVGGNLKTEIHGSRDTIVAAVRGSLVPNSDTGAVALSQFLMGIDTVNNTRTLEILINNSTKHDVVVSRLVYSRGVSSGEMEAIRTCCMSCMITWYAVQRGPVTMSTPGTQLEELIHFVSVGSEQRSYPGRLFYAPGCHGLLFAQMEMNIGENAIAGHVTKIGVALPTAASDTGSLAPMRSYTTTGLLAPPDTICVYVTLGNASRPRKLCRPTSTRPTPFL